MTSSPPPGASPQGNAARAETIDDGLDDRKGRGPEAVFIAAQHAMERVEDALAVLRADAGACVLHTLNATPFGWISTEKDRSGRPSGCSGSRCR